MKLPLEGMRVISFEQFGAAPYATQFLADFGAEVLKVERAQGDFARQTQPLSLGDDDSLYFQSFNTNKKSIVIDLSVPQDREQFAELVRSSEAVVNNLRGNLPEVLGLDYAALSAINPAIVCGHISAYGRNNSRASRPGFDFLMQAEAGLMALTGEPDAVPARMGVSVIDYMSGMMLAYGVVAALHGTKRSGIGCDVDACLFDTALHQLAYQAAWYLNDGLVTGRQPRSAHPTNTPTQLCRTSDGWIYVAAMTDKFWQLLCSLVDAPQLASEQKFATASSRLEHREALTVTLDEVFSSRTTTEWVEALGETLPVAPVLDMARALDSPFVAETGMIDHVEHHAREDLRILANPIRINGQRLPRIRAPRLGEHNADFRMSATTRE